MKVIQVFINDKYTLTSQDLETAMEDAKPFMQDGDVATFYSLSKLDISLTKPKQHDKN